MCPKVPLHCIYNNILYLLFNTVFIKNETSLVLQTSIRIIDFDEKTDSVIRFIFLIKNK